MKPGLPEGRRAWRWLRWALLAEMGWRLLGLFQPGPYAIGAGDVDVSAPLLAGAPSGLLLFPAGGASGAAPAIPVPGRWCVRRNALVFWSDAPEMLTVVPPDGPIRRFRLPARTPSTGKSSVYSDTPGGVDGQPIRMTPHPEGVTLCDGVGCYLFRFTDGRLTALPDALDAISKEDEARIAVADTRGRVRFVDPHGRTLQRTSVTLDLSRSSQPDWDWSARRHLIADGSGGRLWREGQVTTTSHPNLWLWSVQIDEASGTLRFSAVDDGFFSFGRTIGIAVFDPVGGRFLGWRQQGVSLDPPLVEATPELVRAFHRLRHMESDGRFR